MGSFLFRLPVFFERSLQSHFMPSALFCPSVMILSISASLYWAGAASLSNESVVFDSFIARAEAATMMMIKRPIKNDFFFIIMALPVFREVSSWGRGQER